MQKKGQSKSRGIGKKGQGLNKEINPGKGGEQQAYHDIGMRQKREEESDPYYIEDIESER